MKFPPGMPPELQKYMQEVYDHQDMASSEWSHSVARFLESLDKEQISVLKVLFHGFVSCTCGVGRSAAYYEGLLDALGSEKFDICIGCGENHLESIQKLTEEGDISPLKDGGEDLSPFDDENKGKAEKEIDEADLMKLYGVVPSDDFGPGSVQCINCKFTYPNLEDRMRRDPGVEGCQGCIQKAKWG